MTEKFQSTLINLITELKEAGQMPKHMDFAKIGNRYWCAAYDKNIKQVISEEVFTGFSNSKEIATLKALVERIERKAFVDGAKSGSLACIGRSDGFAAFPKLFAMPEMARSGALNEAIERYVWATWWDNNQYSFDIFSLEQFNLSAADLLTLKEIQKQIGVIEFKVIVPQIANADEKLVIILFAKTITGGYISGGACANNDDCTQAVMRGMDELYRHGLALKRIRSKKLTPSSFYEARLAYFGFGLGTDLVEARLNAQGFQKMHLPNLVIDENIPHSMEKIIDVHRCLFKDQPPFVGGQLERLCL